MTTTDTIARADWTDHYRRSIHTWGHQPRLIAAAYRAAGLDAPEAGRGVADILATIPTAAALAATLAAGAMQTTDPDTWTADALARIQQAAAADELRLALAAHREHAIKANATAALSRTVTDIEPAFAGIVAKLSKAAKKLPTSAPLDPGAVFAADATAAYRDALDCLEKLAAIASMYEALNRPTLDPRASGLAPVLTWPEVPEGKVNRITRQPVGPASPARDALRALVADASERVGPDVALVKAARGDYGDHVTFKLAADRHDLAARIDRLDSANRNTIDDGGPTVTVL